MTPLNIRFHDDRLVTIFPDLEEGTVLGGRLAEVVVVADGVDGADGVTRPSVLFRVELPDDQVVVAITTARMFCAFADAIRAKHPKVFEGKAVMLTSRERQQAEAAIREAADRVRVARAMAAARQDVESMSELAEALEAFDKLRGRL